MDRPANARELTLFPYPKHRALQAARQVGVYHNAIMLDLALKAPFSQSLRVHDRRHARYIGLQNPSSVYLYRVA